MKWLCCELISKEKSGEDELHNPVYTDEVIKTTVCRSTPWISEQKSLEGRKVTYNEMYYIIPIPFRMFPKCQKCKIDGKEREIVKIFDFSPRFTAVQVKAYKEKI